MAAEYETVVRAEKLWRTLQIFSKLFCLGAKNMMKIKVQRNRRTQLMFERFSNLIE